jgi:hypothetical protein
MSAVPDMIPAMDRNAFWGLIDEARSRAADDHAVPAAATALLAVRPREDILAFQQILWDLMAESYRDPLWGAAYQINGGCSDDGFDYFRAWLIGQGRAAYEGAVADPDSLATLPVVQAAAEQFMELDQEDVLSIAWNAYRTAFGEAIPQEWSVRYPKLEGGWDFDDRAETRRRLPRLTALYDVHYAE